MSTKAIQVKVALETLLSGLDATDDSVDVTYGLPTRAPGRRWASVGDVRWRETEWSTNRSRQEVFAVSVILNVQIPGATSRDVEDAVLEIATEFEAALANDPSLGGLCITTNYSPRTLRSWPIDRAFEAQLDTEVVATCRP